VLVDDIVLAKKMKINFSYHVDNCMLSEGKKITLFRIVQEQMKNILKHSAATITDISLKTVEENVQLTIRDNGKGFNLRNTRHGIGLSNIYERTKFYNGVADVNTEPGKGCTLTISLPIFS
jgi:two-component system sensor histidine kinase UhpB